MNSCAIPSGAESVGLAWERYSAVLKSFILSTGAIYQPDVTEQTGREVWDKVWKDPYDYLRKEAKLVVLVLDPRYEIEHKAAKGPDGQPVPIDYAGVLGQLISERLGRRLPTWVFAPLGLDSPGFAKRYGESLVKTIRANFSAVQFDKPQSVARQSAA